MRFLLKDDLNVDVVKVLDLVSHAIYLPNIMCSQLPILPEPFPVVSYLGTWPKPHFLAETYISFSSTPILPSFLLKVRLVSASSSTPFLVASISAPRASPVALFKLSLERHRRHMLLHGLLAISQKEPITSRRAYILCS